MGGGKDKEAVRRQARAQERTAKINEELARFMKEQGIEDRELQKQIYGEISPFAESLMDTYDPEEFKGLERPDISGRIRRDYADERAGIYQDRNKAIGESEDFYTASGLGRTGLRGMSAGSIYSMANSLTGDARRRMQNRLTEEELNKYHDLRSRRGEEAQLGIAGANIKSGQQGVFNPNTSYRGASGAASAAGAGHGGAASSYDKAARMPTLWSRIGGAALGAGSAALGNPVGLRNIWSGGGKQ